MKYSTPHHLLDSDWFMEISPKHRLLWWFMNAKCDAAGVWMINFRLSSMFAGERVTEKDFKAYGARVRRLTKEKIFIPSFVFEQAGQLKPNNGFHKHILNLLSIHGLTINDLQSSPINPYSTPTLVGVDTPIEGEGEENSKNGEESEEGPGGLEAPLSPVTHENPSVAQKSNGKFVPPESLECHRYAEEIRLPISEADKFLDYYTMKGWRVGSSTQMMKDWKASMRNWKRNWEERNPSAAPKKLNDKSEMFNLQNKILNCKNEEEKVGLIAEYERMKNGTATVHA